MPRFTMGPNRYICSVLDELRKLDKTRNYAPLLSLVEEAQVLANRMEAALEDAKDVEYLHAEKKKLEKQIESLKAKKNMLSGNPSEEED